MKKNKKKRKIKNYCHLQSHAVKRETCKTCFIQKERIVELKTLNDRGAIVKNYKYDKKICYH